MGDAAITRYSPAECRQIARLAARGVGLPWGLADDAGLAAEWLAMRGLPFAPALFARARGGFCAADENAILRGKLIPAEDGEKLCPFAAGAIVCDLARARPLLWDISRVARPLAVAPFAARAAAAAKTQIQIQWQETTIITDGETAAAKTIVKDAPLADVRISPFSPAAPRANIALPPADECKIPAREWRKLNALAARTFVPSSDASRLRGAGAKEDGD